MAFPSLAPSTTTAPSMMPVRGGYCRPQDVIGRVFFASAANNCFKIEVGVGGSLIGDNTDPFCNVKSGTGVTFSSYNGFSGGTLNWAPVAGFSGTMDFFENTSLSEPKLVLDSFNPNTLVFDVTLELPSCEPPITPTPSMAVSAPPSAAPSLGPLFCTAEQVSGNTFFAPFVGICFMIQLIPNAFLVGDNNDATCALMSGLGIPFSIFQGFLPNTDIATFGVGPAGYDGIMYFARDPSLTSPMLINNGLAGKTFNVTLALPECP